MKIEIWSDVVCPFCYIGKRHLESALAEFDHRDDVTVEWHSFQLNPSAPAQSTESTATMLSSKYGMTLAQAEESNTKMTANAAAVGLDFHLDQARSGNTRDVHRLIHLAADHGLQGAAKERFLAGYFTDGAPIGDHDALTGLAVEVGLDEVEVRDVLASDRFGDAVDADIAQAHAYGVQGVPFFVFDEKFAVSGAQPVEVFSEALSQAWADAHPLPVFAGSPDAGTCTDDSCAV
ncbi:MAG: DsbA family oxidoreductase [Jatrophihabitans sp.]